jgi:hypothetical protein
MQGMLDVSYDGGATWANLLTLDSSNTLGSETAANVNERRVLSVPNPEDGTMVFKWTNTGSNDWWWGIDNINVTGTVDGLPSPGITAGTTWNFTTADAATLVVAVAATATEGDAPLTGTVTRTLGTVGDLVVTLTSSDTGAATVPATVLVPGTSTDTGEGPAAYTTLEPGRLKLVTLTVVPAGATALSSTFTLSGPLPAVMARLSLASVSAVLTVSVSGTCTDWPSELLTEAVTVGTGPM